MKKTVLLLLLCMASGALMADNSPYISRVYEFLPAPGQFVNTMPAYEQGDDAEAMCRKVEEQIANNAQGLISLGGWGGYVVFGFDHPLVNVQGEKDLIVEGNAFYSNAAQGAAGGGSCEPGIVMVSVDANGNDLPDDEWYELAGSEYLSPLTKHGYSVTYERTPADHVATPSSKEKYRIDTTHVHWTDNDGGEGYLVQISFHKQPYFPQWIDSDELTFEGARLADNYQYINSQYVLYPYQYGYADNHPDTCSLSQLDIEWAVRADGTPVHLEAVHFVKVYTALHQQCGMIGETSTEVKGARDLHPDAPMPENIESIQHSASGTQKILRNGQLLIIRNKQTYNPLGIQITNY